MARIEAKFFQLLRINRRRRPRHEITRLLIFREGDDVADVRGAGEHHGKAVEAQRDAAVRWSAELEGVEQEPEARFRLLFGHAEHLEEARLHLRVVDTDAAATAFVAVDDEIVRLGAYAARIAFELGEILVH